MAKNFKNIKALTIYLDSSERWGEYDFSKLDFKELYDIHTSKDDKLEDCVADKKTFEKSIEEYMDGFEIRRSYAEEDEDYEEYAELYDLSDEELTYDNFFNDNYYIKIKGDPKDIVEFLNNSNFDCDRITISKLEIGKNLDIDNKDFIETLLDGLNRTDNIYVSSEENFKLVKLEEYKKTIDYIDKMAERVKSKDLSPIEQLMYLYDIVRDRYYFQEKRGQSFTESRDLTAVTSGKNIVCEGFAKIYAKVAQKLGFNSDVLYLDPNNNQEDGHARTIIYVKDDKYNINGVYVFDPTYDCKKRDNNNHFNSYKYFAKTYNLFSAMDKTKNSTIKNDPMERLYKTVNHIRRNQTDEIDRISVSRINTLHEKFLNEPLLNTMEILSFDSETKEGALSYLRNTVDKDRIYADIMNFYKLFNKEISPEVFLQILTNVRIKEYYENPEKFPLSVEKLANITRTSTIKVLNPELILLRAIFGEKIKEPTYEEILEDSGRDKDIAKVKVAKTLRKVLEKKQNQ